jgi:hypothetical protein
MKMAKLDTMVTDEDHSDSKLIDEIAEPVFEEPIDDFFNTDF